MSKLRYASGLKGKLKALVPRRIKYTLLADCIELVLARTHFLDGADEPPSFMDYSGGGFVPIGNHLVQLMMARAGLADGMVVVDIGCGIGRMAVAMSKRLREIRYVGFDVVNYGILWCRKRFSALPGYRFVHANIFNTFYNPRGSEAGSSYRFPVSDSTADFVCATSVFTHMPASEVTHYLRETSRCMKRGAKAYFTAFILDQESRGQIEANRTLLTFAFDISARASGGLRRDAGRAGFGGGIRQARLRSDGGEIWPGSRRFLPRELAQTALRRLSGRLRSGEPLNRSGKEAGNMNGTERS